MRVQRDGRAWSSCKSRRNQVASATPLATTLYSDSALERETTVCRLADQVVPEEHDIARRGAMSVRAASPVGVGVDDQVGAGRAVQQQAEVRRPTKIAQDALHGRQVGLPRVVHMQADLLHGISDVGPCER
jgi:hypothetical protein